MSLLRHRRLRCQNRHHCHLLRTFTAFSFLFFSSASPISLPPFPSGGAFKQYNNNHHQDHERNGWRIPSMVAGDEKRSIGPGSMPPSCRSKCGWCSPCEPVHVPIQPGLTLPLEYYPEAWRCKCGNKLFMP